MTEQSTAPALIGRALWESNPRHFTYDVLVHDREAFGCSISDYLSTHELSILTGDAFGGEHRKEYDQRRKALYAYMESHEVDPELRKLIGQMEDKVYDFAGETWIQGMESAGVVEQFRTGLLSLTAAK